VIEIREPFPEYAWPQVWHWTRDIASRVEDDFAPKTLEAFVEYSVDLAARSRTWGVWRDGELGGLMLLEPLNPVAGLAHLVFKRSFWGRATTDHAILAACRQVFESGLLKVCGMVFEDNNAVRAMYRRIGFREEGKLHGQTLRGGKPVNVIACGMTKEIWDGINNGTRGAARREEQLAQQPDLDVQQHNDAELHAGANTTPEPTGHNAVQRTDEPVVEPSGGGRH
jgi:RimJ/RimL family protein N-acetyltransferase